MIFSMYLPDPIHFFQSSKQFVSFLQGEIFSHIDDVSQFWFVELLWMHQQDYIKIEILFPIA